MTKEQSNVKEFMLKAQQDCPSTPTIPSLEVRKLRAKLILEEAFELITQGLGLWFTLQVTETGKYIEVILWPTKDGVDLIKLADGCADLCVVTDGAALACGIDMEEIRAEVDRSNLSKFIDGHRREDGKWIKGPSYSLANLAPILEKQNVIYPG